MNNNLHENNVSILGKQFYGRSLIDSRSLLSDTRNVYHLLYTCNIFIKTFFLFVAVECDSNYPGYQVNEFMKCRFSFILILSLIKNRSAICKM